MKHEVQHTIVVTFDEMAEILRREFDAPLDACFRIDAIDAITADFKISWSADDPSSDKAPR